MAAPVKVDQTGAVSKGITPVTDILSPSMIKRLQDYGYSVVHSSEPAPAKKSARKSAKKKKAKKVKKAKAKKAKRT